jgi:two-component system response regulator RegX3
VVENRFVISMDPLESCLATKRALIICNNRDVLQQISTVLMTHCIDVTIVRSVHLLREIEQHPADVCIADLTSCGSPDSSVLLSRQTIRKTPLLLITPTQQIKKYADSVYGSDDFLAFPFDAVELLIRVQKLFQRNLGSAAENIRHWGNLTLDSLRCQVFCGSREVKLTKKEFDILSCLFDAEGKVITRDELLSKVWGMHYFGNSNVLDVHIKSLRKKLEEDPANPKCIITTRGIGYRLGLGL